MAHFDWVVRRLGVGGWALVLCHLGVVVSRFWPEVPMPRLVQAFLCLLHTLSISINPHKPSFDLTHRGAVSPSLSLLPTFQAVIICGSVSPWKVLRKSHRVLCSLPRDRSVRRSRLIYTKDVTQTFLTSPNLRLLSMPRDKSEVVTRC